MFINLAVHRALVPMYFEIAGHLPGALRMTSHKSKSSVGNVRSLKPIAPFQMSSFVCIFGHFYRSHWLFLTDISNGANGFLDVILRAPLQMSVFRNHGTVILSWHVVRVVMIV